MSDQRNLIVTIVLSLGIMLLWQVFVAEPQMEKERKIREANKRAQQAEQSEAIPKAGGLAPGAEPGAAKILPREAALAQGARITISSPMVDGSLALEGARFDDLKLKKYKESLNEKSPEIILLSPKGTNAAYYASFGWAAAGDIPVPGPGTIWQAEDTEPLTPDHPITLRWDNGRGLVFIRSIALDDKYMFTITDRVENTGTAPVALAPYGLIARHGVENHQSQWILHEGLLGVFDGTLETAHYKDIAKEGHQEFTPGKPGGWLGITDKYWLAALIPDQSETITAKFLDRKLDDKDVYQTDFIGGTASIAPGASISETHHFFAGAKEVGVIDYYEDSLNIAHFDLAIDWGWFYFLTRPIFRLLDFFNKLVGNFGIAILLLTVTIKAALFPLANRSYESMSKMKKVQPEMKKIQERYKDDKAKQQEALLELYKKEKVNPLAGCLPIFIQIPIFFALYKVLFVTIEMRHAPFFGWIRDLSAADPTSLFNLFGLLPYEVPGFLGLNHLGVLPLLMGLTMYLQTKMNPAPADPIQEKVFLLMPFIFTFMMAPFPAGLIVYWTWNNTLSIAQQYVIMKRMGVDFEWDKKFPRMAGWLRGLRTRAGASQQPGE